MRSEGKHRPVASAGKHVASKSKAGRTWKSPLWPVREKNVGARKGGKICNHRQARKNINGGKREMRRAHDFFPSSFQSEDFPRAHLLARLTYLMEIYRWTAVWLTVHTGMVVMAPPMERVQKVSRTVGFGLKL